MLHIRRLHFVALAALLLAVLPAPGRAQANGITWELAPGFNGSFKAGAWFPFVITIGNTGPDIADGRLSIRFASGDSSTYSQSVDLPLNAQKRLVIPVLSESNLDGSVRAVVSLHSGNTMLHSERIDLRAVSNIQNVVGVISDGGNVLPELANLQPNPDNGFPTVLLRVASSELPDRAELLQSFDLLFVHGVDPTGWSDAQRAALRAWVQAGGQLILSGDARVLNGLDALTPAIAQGASSSGTLQGLQATGWPLRAANAATSVPLLPLAAQPAAEVVLRGDAQQPLLVRHQIGNGSVLAAAFDLEALATVGNAANFWSRVLPISNQAAVAFQLRDQGFAALRQALELPALRLPSTLGFVSFLLLYILVIGPLNYLLLRRIDRREWAYLTIPLLVVLFSVGAYTWGTLGRGRSAVLSELSVVRVPADSSTAPAISYLALFSPQRHAYDVRLSSAALVADLQPAWDRQGDAPDVLYAEDSTRVPELLIDVGGVRALSVEQFVPAPQLVATVNGDRTQLTIRNTSDQPLEDVVVARGDGQVQALNTLAPGDEQTVELVFDRFFPDVIADASSRIINRREVLSQLNTALLPLQFADGRFMPGAMPAPVEGGLQPTAVAPGDSNNLADAFAQNVRVDPAQQLFIFGWQSRALTAATLDGQPASTQGETLYQWPVRQER